MNKKHRDFPFEFLQGFESAARHLSFTRAAEELYLTQSAVSRQVSAIESHLGVPLFLRKNRALELTEHGRRLQAAAQEMLQRISAVAEGIRRSGAKPVVTVTMPFAIASLWLIPRLGRFLQAHPDMDVRLSANDRIVDLERDNVDVAIRYCANKDAPPGAVRLFGDAVVAVCSKSYLKAHPLRHPRDLERHVLLKFQDETGYRHTQRWAAWLEFMGVPRLRPAAELRFNQYEHAIQAAVEGQGVALGVVAVVADLVKSGRLVVAFDQPFGTMHSFYVITASHAAGRPEVKEFVAWLASQAETPAASAPGQAKRARRGH